MDITFLTKCSLETVGFIQVLKNFMPKSFPKKLYALLMALCAIGFTAMETYLPSFMGNAVLVVCVSQLGYESILQSLKRLIPTGKENDSQS